MTETVTRAVADSTQTTAPETTPIAVEVQVGRQLENARKALQLSVIEMAQRLRLGEKQVLALETGDLAALPGKTFVRGFVRNYARAVQLDSEPLLHLLDSAEKLSAPKLDLPESTHVAMPEQGNGVNRDFLTVAAGLLLVAIAAALYFFLPEQWLESLGKHEQNTQTEESQPFLENEEILPEDGEDEIAQPDQTEVPATATNANTTTPAPQPITPKPPTPQTPATPATVTPKPATAPAVSTPPLPRQRQPPQPPTPVYTLLSAILHGSKCATRMARRFLPVSILPVRNMKSSARRP